MSEYYSRLMDAVFTGTAETLTECVQGIADWYGLNIQTVRHDAMLIYHETSTAFTSAVTGHSAN